MKKFLLSLICLASCIPTYRDIQVASYAAAIDTTCFMYAVTSTDDNKMRAIMHKRCIEVLTDSRKGVK